MSTQLSSISGNGTDMAPNAIAFAGAHGDVQSDTSNLGYDPVTQTLNAKNITVNGTTVLGANMVTDEIYTAPLSEISVSSGETCTLTRNAEGDWSYNITSTGATTYFGVTVPKLRTTASKGWKVTGVNVSYALGVVDATSITPVFDSVAYVNGVAPAVTATFGGTITYDTAHNSAGKRVDYDVPADGEHTMNLTLGTPVYFTTASAKPVFELQVVLANTGTFKLRQVEFLITEVFN